ncbi:MAG: AAA family ATPase [Bacillota bacterium]
MKVDGGEVLLLMGPSGSGKTTLLAEAARKRGKAVVIVSHDTRPNAGA